MLKREKLVSILKKITDDEFAALWKNTYGCLPQGSRADLARDFAAEQYDGELDSCIANAESLLTHAPKVKVASPPKSKWLPPR
jgi:hypothetical protein